MSVKSQESNMRRLSVLLSHDLSYAYGDSEGGPNGSKKVFLNVGKAFLRALSKDLGAPRCHSQRQSRAALPYRESAV